MSKNIVFNTKIFLILSMVCLLSACSVFGPVESDSSTAYTLNVNSHPITKHAYRPITLFVAPVESDSIYNTNQIAYSTQAYQIAYFAKSRWAETPSRMLQPLIVKALQNTSHFHAVSSMLALGNYDYLLNTQLIELKQVFWANASQVHLKLRAQLIRATNGHVIAIKEFDVVENAPQRTPYGGVIAANRATDVLLKQLASFCLQKI